MENRRTDSSRGQRVHRSKRMFRKTRSGSFRNTRRMIFGVVFAVCFLLATGVGGIIFWIWYNTPVFTEEPVSIYMGEEIPAPTEWFTRLRGEAVFGSVNSVDGESELCFSEISVIPGVHSLTILTDGGSTLHEVELNVIDNVAPVANPVNVTSPVGIELSPSDFYSDLFDHSETTSKFLKEPDIEVAGIYEVIVQITDSYGNYTVIEALCEIFNVTESITVERGTPAFFVLSDFASFTRNSLIAPEDVILEMDLPDDFYKTVGVHDVAIVVEGVRHYSKIEVVVTTPPNVVPVTVTRFVNEPNPQVESSAFFRVPDEYACEYIELTSEFVTTPNWSSEGSHPVTIRVLDQFGNTAEVDATLQMVTVTEPPVINGTRDFSVLLGNSIAFRHGITVTDAYDPNPHWEIDSSAVVSNQVGVYPVTHTVTNRAGLSTSVTINVHIVDVEEGGLAVLVQQRLNELGVFETNNMIERARLIHRYVFYTMTYQNNPSNPNDEVRFAYNTLRGMRGNCIASQRAAEALLTGAGIENVRIHNTVAFSHAWNLININGTWYHFDASRFRYCRGSQDTHMFSAARAAQLNQTRANVYTFDESLFPVVS